MPLIAPPFNTPVKRHVASPLADPMLKPIAPVSETEAASMVEKLTGPVVVVTVMAQKPSKAGWSRDACVNVMVPENGVSPSSKPPEIE